MFELFFDTTWPVSHVTIYFEAEETGRLHLRTGTIRVKDKHGSRELHTPHFHPIMNIITGPPTRAEYLDGYGPLSANGGIWKWIKRLALRDVGVPYPTPEHPLGAKTFPPMEGFLTQVLHFIDYHITEDMLDRWLGTHGGEPKTIVEYMREELAQAQRKHPQFRPRKKPPFLFLDSGGYKLLSSQQIDLSRYGWTANPRDILNIQLAFGGDLLATLDYPVHPQAADADARERYAKSMNNAIEALTLLRDSDREDADDKLLYLAVHGRNRREMHDYMRALLKRVAEEKLYDRPFGLALGSLVPLNSSPRALMDSVRGAMEAFHAANEIHPRFDPNKIPVHAFGVNSGLAPLVTFMGVDSYDGSSFVQAAHKLTYLSPGGFTPWRFERLTDLPCGCRGCTLMKRGRWENAHRGAPTEGLEAVKYIMSPESQKEPESGEEENERKYFEWKDGYADNLVAPPKTKLQRDGLEDTPQGVPRSYFYGLLALHNMETSLNLAATLRSAKDSAEPIELLTAELAKNVKSRKILQMLTSYEPELSDYLWRIGVKRLGSRVTTRPLHSTGNEVKQVKPLAVQVNLDRKPVGSAGSRAGSAPAIQPNPHLGPSDFDIEETSYEMPRVPVVLLLPCSKRKPYSESSTHKFVRKHLEQAGIPMDQIHIVTMSGNYGPVPQPFETADNVLAYDYMLHATNKDRIELVADRTRRFLLAHETKYKVVIGYCTPKPYRKAMQLALEARRNAKLLPDPLRAHTVSEFRNAKNIQQLVDEIKKHVTPKKAIPAE